MTAQDRLIANSNSIISSLVAFSSDTPQDVSYTWINDDETTSVITYKNIVKFQQEAQTDLNVLLKNKTDEFDTTLIAKVEEMNKLISDTNDTIEDIKEDAGELAISSTNLQYKDGELQDKDGTEIGSALVLDKTNIQLVDGAILDKDGNIVPIGDSSTLKSTILYDKNDVGTYIAGETWDEHTAYSRTHQYTKGQFAVSTNTFDDKNQMKVQMRIAPFQVDQETGKMTWGNFGYGYKNDGGKVHSTQSFGFCGNIGMAWGNSAWGTDNTHRYGGCTWRVNDDNTVTQGGNTGDTAYTRNEMTSNGMLALQEYNGKVYFHIPTYDGNSKASANGGYIDESDASLDSLPSLDGGYIPDSTSSTCYIWRCIGKEVGQNKAGLFNYKNNTSKLVALTATGNNASSGDTLTVDGTVREGIGFELESGEQLYTSSIGTFVRESETGGIATCTISEVGGTVSLSSGINIKSNMSYYTGGYPAKEEDTFYVLDSSGINFIKIKFTKVSDGNYTVKTLGSMNITTLRGRFDISSYDGLLDVTGNDDQFLVVSARYTTYQPTHTIVVDNPMKDL